MGNCCTTPIGSRDWTKEEMTAYLDWNSSENDRVDDVVAQDIGSNPVEIGRRGVAHIWKRIEKDIQEQQRLISNR